MTCRKWLSENGYEDVVKRIDAAMSKMAARGSKQRRNWWDILSGGVDGTPCVCEGIEFQNGTEYLSSKPSAMPPPVTVTEVTQACVRNRRVPALWFWQSQRRFLFGIRPTPGSLT